MAIQCQCVLYNMKHSEEREGRKILFVPKIPVVWYIFIFLM